MQASGSNTVPPQNFVGACLSLAAQLELATKTPACGLSGTWGCHSMTAGFPKVVHGEQAFWETQQQPRASYDLGLDTNLNPTLGSRSDRLCFLTQTESNRWGPSYIFQLQGMCTLFSCKICRCLS